ncbi:hypothetical protein GJAV_G00194490 [Gymnothorax javanicus]|nr:hypothetical protein GJAV_G00194490 [Gymnothorax javanicus]
MGDRPGWSACLLKNLVTQLDTAVEGTPGSRSGGDVTFSISNDAPTLTGAKTTFNIEIHLPEGQTVSADGGAVWAENGTLNGTHHQGNQAVYTEPDTTEDWSGLFPDGTPFNSVSGKKPHYVYVWKTWGQYWQVADGPSSALTIGTDEAPLGSYNMEVVIYHIRSKEKFIPLGYACSQFTITDQVPFTLSLSQVNDVNVSDQCFVQNRAITFSISLHDPSRYLSDADITFNWDFGDGSGTLISRELSVTHTYTSAGAYQPRLALQAIIPKPGCATPANVPTAANPTPAPVTSTPPGPRGETGTAGAVRPAEEALQALEMEGDQGIMGVQTAVQVVRREVPAVPSDAHCVIYRYGSFSSDLSIVPGIETVAIVQMENVVMETAVQQSAVDLTIICRGGLPTQVCTVILDAGCAVPVHSTCSAISPSAECQLVLRQFFNASGIFCVNVSLTDDVSVAVTSARVRVTLASGFTIGAAAAALGLMILGVALCAVAFSYRHLKDYLPLREDPAGRPSLSTREASAAALIWDLLAGPNVGEKRRPLLPG